MPEEVPFDPATTSVELESSLAELETALSPLFKQEWAAQMDGLDPLERAKMDVMIAYTIVDLIWIYLKMKGVDPAKHEVSSELERVRTYYGKIRSIENPEDDSRKYKLDTQAAGRFIAHGIPRNQRVAQPASSTDLPESSAAGAALAGRQRAAAEQEKASLDRLAKSGRMRFIPDQAERVIVGQAGREGAGGDDEEEEDDDEEQETQGKEQEVIEEVVDTGTTVSQDGAEAAGATGEAVDQARDVVVLEDSDDGKGGGRRRAGPVGAVGTAEVIEISNGEDDDEDEDFQMLDGPPKSGGDDIEGFMREVDGALGKAKRKRAEEF
ncbi:Sas10/Utp3/C1D family-domain-containing protein [Dioszegia hungarica]|uniref:Exosome complex protein n=1 Tax=Dioszegia hungarica TaxID=4972 RepID=A0AA38HH27_9TREE|nr:Sas10/Utp3/C1D family-domain-containing protein [Dioszegia hungarica]KAI9639439.1 Sas10/Utp3/C1D family-domain-containing protein [Dioszegia hungarica]